MRYSSYERPLTFFDIVGSIFRYKWRVLLVTGLMLMLSATAIAIYPKKYESEAKLFVRLGRGSASLDPATFGQTISIQESRETEMNSIVDMLNSRGLAERIVEEVGADRILAKYAWVEVQGEKWGDWLTDSLKKNIPAMEEGPSEEGDLNGLEIQERKRFENAVKELAENLKIDSPKKSTTIAVAFRGRTPELARDVVQAVLDAYGEMHIEAYQSGGALDFFGEQFSEQEQIVARKENELRKKKNANAVVTMLGKQQSLQTEITETKKLQLESRADLEAAMAKVAKLTAELDDLPSNLVSQRTSGIAENATDAMRDRLYQLEIQEEDLSAKYSATHPELMKIREQLKNARRILSEQPQEREQQVTAVNPIRMDVENKMLLAQADVAALQAKVKALQELENELIERLNAVNDLEVEAFELQRDIDIARNNHRSYAQKLEETRINAALDREALSNVSVVAKPTLRYKHASPKRSILAILGLLFSMMCGIGVALISDYSANAREMKAIRDAERVRYLRELEEGREPRTLESRNEDQAIQEKKVAKLSDVASEDESLTQNSPKKAR